MQVRERLDQAHACAGLLQQAAFRPVLWDHRVFSAINVNSGDSIQFTYQLIPNQGG